MYHLRGALTRIVGLIHAHTHKQRARIVDGMYKMRREQFQKMYTAHLRVFFRRNLGLGVCVYRVYILRSAVFLHASAALQHPYNGTVLIHPGRRACVPCLLSAELNSEYGSNYVCADVLNADRLSMSV